MPIGGMCLQDMKQWNRINKNGPTYHLTAPGDERSVECAALQQYFHQQEQEMTSALNVAAHFKPARKSKRKRKLKQATKANKTCGRKEKEQNQCDGQELTIAKLENSVATMEEQQLTTDPRYQKMLQLKSKLTGAPLPEVAQQPSPSAAQQQTQITPAQLNQLRAQVSVYKLLARNEPVPPALAAEAVFMKNKPTSLLPEPYEFPGEGENGEKLPYDLMKV
ncbi:hypothetical protein TELCIR_13060 [Teladorsagia circumcincta]|uniref:QLQ domain-containing protein n=1 Tax=Teladorsagia circumcincta TaxID=45464 RepID=A0A2G9U4V1_TELCI|nr:hypothetical protein TELCIR_13060 [Teladorsagia circumcincta]